MHVERQATRGITQVILGETASGRADTYHGTVNAATKHYLAEHPDDYLRSQNFEPYPDTLGAALSHHPDSPAHR